MSSVGGPFGTALKSASRDEGEGADDSAEMLSKAMNVYSRFEFYTILVLRAQMNLT